MYPILDQLWVIFQVSFLEIGFFVDAINKSMVEVVCNLLTTMPIEDSSYPSELLSLFTIHALVFI